MTLDGPRHDGGMLVIAHRGASAAETENTPASRSGYGGSTAEPLIGYS